MNQQALVVAWKKLLEDWHRAEHASELEASVAFIPGLGMVRECEGCGCLVHGARLNCKRCTGEHDTAPSHARLNGSISVGDELIWWYWGVRERVKVIKMDEASILLETERGILRWHPIDHVRDACMRDTERPPTPIKMESGGTPSTPIKMENSETPPIKMENSGTPPIKPEGSVMESSETASKDSTRFHYRKTLRIVLEANSDSALDWFNKEHVKAVMEYTTPGDTTFTLIMEK